MPEISIVCVSDTHGRHSFPVPDGDILVHAGDFSEKGTLGEVSDFLHWIQAQPHRLKVVIAGNHDLTFHTDHYEKIWSKWHPQGREPDADIKQLLTDPSLQQEGIIYLESSSFTDPVTGLTFYGSPYQPEFGPEMAFALPDEAAAAAHWAQIPAGVDVLITHGPPRGVLDLNIRNEPCGCPQLAKALERVQPRLHVFGHIHEQHGQLQLETGTLCVNASICSEGYKYLQPAQVVKLPAGAPIAAAAASG